MLWSEPIGMNFELKKADFLTMLRNTRQAGTEFELVFQNESIINWFDYSDNPLLNGVEKFGYNSDIPWPSEGLNMLRGLGFFDSTRPHPDEL